MKNIRPLLLSVLLLTALPAWAAAQQSHAEIRAAIESFVRAQTLILPGQVVIQVDEVDRRLALPACPTLEAFVPPGGKLLGNSTIGVRCPDAKKNWTLFVPVQVKVSADLLIASRPLQQGQVLQAYDLTRQRGELAQAGTLTDPALAIGKVLKYSVGAGQVLRQDMLRDPYAVTQGQTVQLQTEGTGFKIRAAGQALNNAAEGQSVRVRTSSGQVVSGTARAGGTVEVRP